MVLLHACVRVSHVPVVLALGIVTRNVRAGSRVKEYSFGVGAEVHAVLVQSHKLQDVQLEEIRQWLQVRGWDFLATSSLVGRPGARSTARAVWRC